MTAKQMCFLIVVAMGYLGAVAPKLVADGGAKPQVIELWPAGAPDAPKEVKPEVHRERGNPEKPNRSFSNVHEPTITVYLPTKEKATGTAVIICPGGGYGGLAIDHEGHDIARWFSEIGVAGVVLKYRLPRPKGHVYPHHTPLMDAQRAMRLTRHHAKDWNVNSSRVGVMGFSAGGHLASTVTTHFDRKDIPLGTDDAISKLSAKPDFAVLIYPVISFHSDIGHGGSRKNLIGSSPSKELVDRYSNELNVTKATPPTFLLSTSDDGVKSENSVRFYLACKKNRVPVEMHIFEKGGHGYSMKLKGKPVSVWPELMKRWMGQRGLVE